MPPKPKRSRKYRVKAANVRPTPTFPFLALSAELRNRIYEYALTSPSGIKMGWTTGKCRKVKKPIAYINTEDDINQPINQLQYVNKQLRREAAGLELQYNTVFFKSTPVTKMGESIANLMRFHIWIGPTRQLWLTHAVVDGFWSSSTSEPPLEEPFSWINIHFARLLHLQQYCRLKPYIRVDLRMIGFELTPAPLLAFLVIGLRLMRIFRSTETLTIEGASVDLKELDADMGDFIQPGPCKWLRGCAANVPNLRLYPINQCVPEGIFDDGAMDGLATTGMRSIDNARKKLLVYSLRWITEGI